MRKIILGLFIALANSAHAQEQPQQDSSLPMYIIANCKDRSETVEYLKKEFGEIGFISSPGIFRRFDGDFSRGTLRIYSNPETYTLTATIEFDDGTACIAFMGTELAPIIQGDSL